jgi:urease accessory protein
MVIVGLWASRIAGSIRWVLPGAFVAFMAVGAALGGLPLPLVEPMILLSILVFALGTVMAKRLPVWAGGLIVALFALYHGHAHFTEIPDTSTAGFVAGMLLATALLHLVGMLIGLAAARARQQTA